VIRRGRAALFAAVAVLSTSATTAAASPHLNLRPFGKTNLPLGDVVAADGHVLYIAERTGQIEVGGLEGGRPKPFAMLARAGEEVRCVPSPSNTWFAPGLYCHTATNDIYRVAPSGRVRLFARLPERRTSDGALAFDTTGRFESTLLAATGRSNDHHGGAVYAIDARGVVVKLGSYPGPGGAENAAIAPKGFGTASGELLLTTDTPSREGRLVAFAPNGRARVLAVIRGDGLNSLAVLPRRWGGRRSGVLVADTLWRTAWFVPAQQLRRYAGDVLVAAELRGWLYIIEPGHPYRTIRLETNLTRSHYNLEGAAVIP
jgi:hypothetical protein